MEPIKIKRRARTIPFGFKQSQDPNYLEPVKEELQALDQAREYSKTNAREHNRYVNFWRDTKS